MINDAAALILQMQTIYELRQKAKIAYHKDPSKPNAELYAEAILSWDNIWQEMVAWRQV